MHRLNTVSNEYGKKITIKKDNVILLKTSKEKKTCQNRATRNTLEERNKADERMLLSKQNDYID